MGHILSLVDFLIAGAKWTGRGLGALWASPSGTPVTGSVLQWVFPRWGSAYPPLSPSVALRRLPALPFGVRHHAELLNRRALPSLFPVLSTPPPPSPCIYFRPMGVCGIFGFPRMAIAGASCVVVVCLTQTHCPDA